MTPPFWCATTRDAVRVSGPDAVSYLQSQLSQDLGPLAVGGAAWSLLLQPNGRVDTLVRVRRTGDEELVVDVERGWGDAVLARLQRFRIRVAAELEPLGLEVVAVRGHDLAVPSGAAAAWWGPECGFDHFDSDALPLSGVEGGDAAALEAARIAAGWPALGREITEQTIPAELGPLLDLAVSFTKGCYPGQELVERMDSRGASAPRTVRRLRAGSGTLASGEPVLADSREVGAVTSSAGDTALAVIGRAVEPGTEVAVGSVTATVLPLR